MSQTLPSGYRDLPSVDRLAASLPDGAYPTATVIRLARETLTAARRSIAEGAPLPDLTTELRRRLDALGRSSLRPVINATGVIIHTNLGRAPLSDAARLAMEGVTRGYSNVEYDLPSGERGSRHGHLERLLVDVTGAEAGLAVNNAASALLLALAALCAGREVVIGRSQLVEIGGGFRIPDVLRQSGARLVEVGTTNRTYAGDYAEAITAETAAILRVHASNFRILGFTHEPEPAALAALSQERGLLLLDDIGSGCLLETAAFGLTAEPTVQASLAGGADLCLFSGDKLLGGPQAGVIVGKRELVERLRRHPLARALRLDKASIAALAATFGHYARGEALTAVPVWRMISAPLAGLEQRAGTWAAALGNGAYLVEARSMVGGGSLPGESLPAWALALPSESPDALARALRTGDPAVVGRIDHGELVLDPRTVHPEEDEELIEAVKRALA